jgi:glycosyltransferase involved in cell wall biosynthesis
MIPTYNCARFLPETLESVLSQDIDPEEMQIEVIDDCSTSDDPEAVVREFGQGRVRFYRQPANVGATGNFNTCIRRSEGKLIHILHGDDYVLPGFYADMQLLAAKSPDAVLFGCRMFFCDEEGLYNHMTEKFKALSPSAHEARDMMSDFNPFQFGGVVVKRSAYEDLGGFMQALIHTADWEMWTRVAGSYQLSLTNKVLAVYRTFPGSDSSRLMKTAENLRDHARFEQIVCTQRNAIDLKRLNHMITNKALRQAQRFDARGESTAAFQSRQFWRGRVHPAKRAVIDSTSHVKTLFNQLRSFLFDRS